MNAVDPSTDMRSVAVIGGGITGLSAAHRLLDLDPRCRVTVMESSSCFGGIIRTESRDGFLMELGPDSFITNKPGGLQLCEDLGITDRLISTDLRYRRSLVLRDGKPLPVPDGFMLMAPAKPWAIATTPILSWRGRARLLGEAFVRKKNNEDDESLASFVRRRFGAEALDRLIQPLVGGIYTADPERLSLRTTLPRFPEMEQSHGSVIRATLAQQRRRSANSEETSGSGARYGLFATPAEGLSSLVDALTQQLQRSERVELRSGTSVRAVKRDDGRWIVCTDRDEVFDAVIISLPTHRAAGLLQSPCTQDLAASLRQIEYASSALVVSAHRLSDFSHPMDAFGLVVPAIERRNVLAVSFSSRKFRDRAPDDCILLRTFVGGAMQPELLDHPDDIIRNLVAQDLRQIFGMTREPLFSTVTRYGNAMPQYHVGHGDVVEQIEQQVRQHPGLRLAGSAYHGVGIPDSIASGRVAAESVAQELCQPVSRQQDS